MGDKIAIYLCFSMGIKVDSIVKESEQALESGQCVVIGLQTTGEVIHV